MHRMMTYITGILAAVVTSAFIYACATSDTGRKQLIIIPSSQMHAMGSQAYTDLLAQEKISTNQALTAEVEKIARRVARASGANFDWEFKLIESEQVNAFCLPGGKIGVYTGIIPVAKTNAGLAAVLGHEVAHATSRHGAERVSQAMIAAGGLVAANVALSDSKYRDGVLAALGLGTQVGVLMPYGRLQESEADEVGLQYSAKAGYEPEEAVKLWQRMAKLGDNRPPEFLSTHPDPNKRAEALSKQIPAVKGLYGASDKQPTETL